MKCYITHMGNGDIAISFKLHMTINELNTTFLLECHYQSLFSDWVITSDCDPMWILVKLMRQKYVVSNIPEEYYVEDTQLQLLWGVKKQ